MSNTDIIRSLQSAMEAKKTTTPYDAPAVVTRIEGNATAWVKIAGSDTETPVKLTIDAKAGDTVQVRVGGGSAWLTGNQSAPPTDDTTAIISKLLAQEADTKAVTAGKTADEAKEEIRAVAADLVVARELIAQKATIEDLNAEKARIDTLDASKANVTDLNAATGRIGQLEATALTADSATIKDLQANKANVSDLTAATGRIGQLEADHVSTADLEAVQADIDNLEATKADVAVLEAGYAKIDLANVNTAQITNGVIQTAAIVDEQVFTVTGNKATIKEINADNINVRNLNAKNLKIETADGYIMLGDKKTPTKEFIDSLTNELNDRIDGAIETFTATAVPTLSNYPANQWKTAEERATHVGDVCYVVNDQIAQNGYCYRFTLNGSTFSWQLIKDSDVTAALARLTTAEGKIGNIESFDEEIATFRTETEDEISTLQTKTTTLETSLGDKVDKSTFNEVSQKVDENSASITTLETNVEKKADSSTVTTLSNTVNNVSQKADSNEAAISDLTEVVETKADGSTVSTLTQTVNSVKQTADGNSSKITSLTTTLGTNADGTTKAGDIVHRTSAVEQDLSGFKTTVASTYHKTSDFNTYKTANDSAVAAAKKAGTDAQSSLDSYKTTNDAAVATAKKAGDDAQADLDEYKGTVSETYATKSALTQTESSIKAEVASTYTTQTTFNNYKSSNDSAVAGVKTTADAAKEAIDGLEIGGRNLVLKSKNLETFTNESKVQLTRTEDSCSLVNTADNTTKYGIYNDYGVSPDTEYVVSATVSDINGEAGWSIGDMTSGSTRGKWSGIIGRWVPFEDGLNTLKFKTPSDCDTIRIYIYTAGNGSGLTISKIKLEKGNLPTDWTPAPEDLEAATTAVASDLETVKTTYVKNSTFETTTEQIRGEVSAVETTAKNYTDGKIATEVSDRNSAITQKADEITSSVSATYATKTSVPTKVSQLTNDSKYATQTEAQGYASTAESNAKTDTTNKLKSYSTTSQMNTAISQSASSIEAKITASETASKEYADGLIEDEVTARDAAIQASADSITSTVSATYATKGSVPTKTSDLTNDSNYATTTQAQGYANTAESNAKADTTEKLKSYSTTAQVTSAINQKAGEITQTVSETYQTKADMDDYSTTTEMNSAIDQKADAITTSVSNTYATKSSLKTTSDNLAGYITSNNAALKTMQDQIDGAIETWFYTVDPTTSNAPAKDWGTTDLKNQHLGDLYYNTATGHVFRWQLSGSTYSWTEIEDTDARKALADAAAAQATANSKRRVFVAQPTTPYEVGDLWVQGTSGDIMRCATARASGSYTASDWVKASKYTDDTALNSFKTTYNTKMEQTDQAIALKANASEVYTKSQTDGLISTEVTNRNAAITAASDSITASVAETYTTKTDFNALEIGGRNLVLKSKNLETFTSENKIQLTRTEDSCSLVNTADNTSKHGIYNDYDVSPDTEYAVSAIVSNISGDVGWSIGDRTSGSSRSGWMGVRGYTVLNNGLNTLIFKTPSDCNAIRIYIYTIGNGSQLTISKIKLEKGNRPTDWSPAPEDLEAYADNAVATAKSEIKVTTDGISTEVAKKVGNDEVISKINQSAETVKIQASKVEVDGTLIIGKTQADAAYDAKGAASTVQDNLDNLQIGGRNLLMRSDYSIYGNANVYTNGSAVTFESDRVTVPYGLELYQNKPSYMANKLNIKIPIGTTITCSCNVYSQTVPSGRRAIYFAVLKENGGVNWANRRVVEQGYSGMLSWQYTLTDEAVGFIFEIDTREGTSGSMVIGLPKVEIGSKATDWSPAPEDVDAGIASAAQTASKYITAGSTSGIKVHAEANPTTNYTQIDETGMGIYQGVDGVATEVAAFKASGARVGRQNSGHTDVDSQGMRVYGGDGTEQLVNIGYGEGNSGDAVATAPYYDFGVRDTTRDIGNYSATFGYANSAENVYSMAAGAGNRSIGSYAYAFGSWLIAHSNQFVTGTFNAADPGKLFIIGNGDLSDDDNDRHNCFTVDLNGMVWAEGGYNGLITTEDVTVSITYAAGNIGTRGASESLGTTVKAGHTYIGAYIIDNRNTSVFNATVQGNSPNNTAHLCVYRATGNAVSDASVTVRKVWLKTGTAQ